MNTETMNRALRAMACGVLVLAGSAGTTALAQPVNQGQIDVSGRVTAAGTTRSTAVSFGDLNLSNAKAQRRLEARLRFAAREVCSGYGMWGMRPRSDYKRCFDGAVEGARGQIAMRQAARNGTPRVATR